MTIGTRSLCRKVWPSQTFWALSIQFMFRFEISEIPCAQWNGTFWLHRPNPSHCVFGYCSCKEDTKEWYWGQQVCQMEQDISVRPADRDNQTSQSGPPSKLVPNIPVGPNWNGPFHFDVPTRNFWNFGLNGKRPLPPVGNIYDGPLLTDTLQYFFITNFVRPRNV